jgi:uncharacterized protein (UPF0210 family)
VLALPEVIETLRMTEAERFDIRTVTLSLSLRDCASRLPATAQARAYDKIRRYAGLHTRVAAEVEGLYGVQIANKRVAVTPVALWADGHSARDMVTLAATLDRAATDVGVDYLAGFSALVEGGTTRGDEALLEALPDALASTARVCGSVNCGSTTQGINADAVWRVAQIVKGLAERTADRDAIAAAKFVAFCNAVPNNPFVAGAFHGPGEREACLNVGISGPGAVLRAVEDVGTGDFTAVCEAVKKTAFKMTRAGILIGERCAALLSERAGLDIPFGVVDLSLAPTPAEGDSIAAVLEAFGLEAVGAPGTTAALAMLNESVKRGGLMAGAHVGGLSGAFMPVSEDDRMIRAAERRHISVEKLEAMSAVCSVGLDMVAIPGDTSAETIAGILLDEFAIGMVNNKTTAVRILPIPGKGVGEWAEFGGLLGRAPILPVSSLSCARMVHRGGRIPAPIRSLTN